MLGRRFSIQLAIAAAVSSPMALFAEDWATFRGSQRTGVAKDTNLLESWPDGGPKLIWEAVGAGRGYASVAVAGDKCYTLGDGCSTASDKEEYLSCFDLKTGKSVWATKTGKPWNEGPPNWQSSRSTPTIDGDKVYVITPLGMLYCCDKNSGKEIWKKDLKGDFGGVKGDSWGYSESPTVDGDLVLCTPGGEKATVVALNKTTGEKVWSTSRPGDVGAGHSCIVSSMVGGQKVYVQVTATGPMGFSAKDGKLLWNYDIPKTTCVIPTPIIRNDLVFFSVGYKRGAALLKQVPGANGEVKVTEVYGLNTKLANKHGGVVAVGDYLFGDSDDQGIPFCAEFMTGKELWRTRGSGKGSAAMSAGDGMLYIQYENGTMALVKASPDSHQEVGKFTIPGSGPRPAWAHPVIVDGKLYIRIDDKICCYDITAK